VELRDRHDRPWHRPCGDQALLLALARVVRVAVDAMDPDDREQDVVPDAGPLLRGEQVSRGATEVRHCFRLVDRGPVAGVDDGLDAGQRVVEPLAGGQVDAERAADAHDVVSAPFEGGDRQRSDVAGGPGDCDPHAGTVSRTKSICNI
jgi:hypothetical protein